MRDLSILADLASKQAGVFSRPQALAAGVSSSALGRACDAGHVVRPMVGVYRFAHAKVDRNAQLWIALCWAGEGAVLSHDSAARIWKLQGLESKAPDLIDVTVPATNRPHSRPNVRIHTSRELRKGADYGTCSGFPCTSLSRTLIDLSGILKPQQLEYAYESAWRRSDENRLALLEALERLGNGRLGTGELSIIARREQLGATQSWLEARVRMVLRRHGIPLPMPQLAIEGIDKRQIGVFDFAWPDRWVVVCVDSREWHFGHDPFEKDRVQASALLAAGWKPVPVTHHRLNTDEAGFIAELRACLGADIVSR